jgi:hypothetical protein
MHGLETFGWDNGAMISHNIELLHMLWAIRCVKLPTMRVLRCRRACFGLKLDLEELRNFVA